MLRPLRTDRLDLEALDPDRDAAELHAGLAEAGRLPRVYHDRVAQQIVMARAAEPRDPDTYSVRPVLPVGDVRATAGLLISVLGLHLAFEYGRPPGFARLGVEPWSGSPGIDLRAADVPIAPAAITVEVGVLADVVYERALAAGVEIASPPADQPWARRECAFVLPDGHHVRVSGPTAPEVER